MADIVLYKPRRFSAYHILAGANITVSQVDNNITISGTGGGGGGGGVTDHGALTGLSDDDHSQYHDDARGDVRYYTKSQVDTSLSGKADNNTAYGQVDFGYASGGEGNFATVTVSAAWASSTSTIICSPKATATADHDPDDYAVEGLKAYATNIVDGVGFDIVAVADYATWGQYNVQAIGV